MWWTALAPGGAMVGAKPYVAGVELKDPARKERTG
jgi:hypothetical protein